jgi:hypothetical protein
MPTWACFPPQESGISVDVNWEKNINEGKKSAYSTNCDAVHVFHQIVPKVNFVLSASLVFLGKKKLAAANH